MTFAALATDYDDTIAHHGAVDRPTLDALIRARNAGLRLILVTGRELSDLLHTFAHVALFDRIVAENGAVLYDPGTQTVTLLAAAPPRSLRERLAGLGVPLSFGRSIIATIEPHQHELLAAIRDLGLEWHVIFNKGSVMALPAHVTKATGLAPALAALGISHDQTVGVGDAENDHAFLSACGLAVAVSNALPSVKAIAHVVTTGARGAGVAEFIDHIIAGGLECVDSRSRAGGPERPA